MSLLSWLFPPPKPEPEATIADGCLACITTDNGDHDWVFLTATPAWTYECSQCHSRLTSPSRLDHLHGNRN